MRDGVPRPKPPWAPFPLSELLVAAGLVTFAVGMLSGGGPRSTTLITIGVAVLTLTIVELCAREHLAGFRSHSLLLAVVPVAGLHTFMFAVVTDSWRGPLALFVDLGVFGALALVLKSLFNAARRAR